MYQIVSNSRMHNLIKTWEIINMKTFRSPRPRLRLLTVAHMREGIFKIHKQRRRYVEPASVTDSNVLGVLTTVLLVAAVGAIIIIIASPQGRDAPSVLALKLPGFTLRLRMSSCVVRGKKEQVSQSVTSLVNSGIRTWTVSRCRLTQCEV